MIILHFILHAIRAGRVQKNQKKKPHNTGKRGQGKNKMGYAQNNVPFAPKPKTPPPPKKDNPAKDAICHLITSNSNKQVFGQKAWDLDMEC
ncbi:hypothetical protein Tco_0441735 [Tanacetum coccineum]